MQCKQTSHQMIAVSSRQQGILQKLDEILEASRLEGNKSNPEPSQRQIQFVRQEDQRLSETERQL